MKVELKRYQRSKDPFVVPEEFKKKYPGKHFVFAQSHPSNISKKKGLRYEVANINPDTIDKTREAKRVSGEQIDSTYTHGDTILMVCNEEDYKENRELLDQELKFQEGKELEKIRQEVKNVGKDIGKDIEVIGSIKEEKGR